MRVEPENLPAGDRENIRSVISEGSARMLGVITLILKGEEREDLVRRQMAITKLLFSVIGAESSRSLEGDFESFTAYATELGLWES